MTSFSPLAPSPTQSTPSLLALKILFPKSGPQFCKPTSTTARTTSKKPSTHIPLSPYTQSSKFTIRYAITASTF